MTKQKGVKSNRFYASSKDIFTASPGRWDNCTRVDSYKALVQMKIEGNRPIIIRGRVRSEFVAVEY